jgi:hypothetical protein
MQGGNQEELQMSIGNVLTTSAHKDLGKPAQSAIFLGIFENEGCTYSNLGSKPHNQARGLVAPIRYSDVQAVVADDKRSWRN